jgi:type I restriction enzyme S subunit
MSGRAQDWPLKRLRFVTTSPTKREVRHFDEETEVSFVPMESIGEDGQIEATETKTIGEVQSGYTYFRNGDVVIAKITPCFENGKGAIARGLINTIGFGTTELHVIRSSKDLDARFLFYITKSHQFRKLGEGEMYGAGGQKRVPESFIQDFRQPMPSITEQREIADFLDYETSRLSGLISAKKALIDLALEKRKSFVSEICTRGLHYGVKKRHSGVATVGEVPLHWRIIRNKALFCEIDQRSVDGAEELLSVSHITGVTRRSEKPEVTMFMAESLDGYKKCKKDDLIINTMWAWMGALGISGCDGIVSPAYNVYRLREKVLPAYLDLLYRTPQYITEFTRWSKGVWESRLRLYPFEFFQVLTPLPPYEEQQAIVAAVERATGGVQDAVIRLEESISKLEEYRTVLISGAVIGQIDVRNYRPLEASAVCQ